MTNRLAFHWGHSNGLSMLAPGMPDLLFCMGPHIAWINFNGLFILKNDCVEFQPFENVDALSIGPESATIRSPLEQGFRVQRLGLQDIVCAPRIFEGRDVQVGSHWVVVDTGAQRSAYDLDTGEEIALPVGAQDARPKPWPDAPGAVWVDGTNVYRMRDSESPRLVGSLPAHPEEWIVGPQGSVFFALADSSWAAPGRGSLVEIEGIDPHTVRFSADGTALTGNTENGVIHVDLLMGKMIRRLDNAHLTPVGFDSNGTALLLQESSGSIRTWNGKELAHGFSPSAVVRHGDFLYGPGGTAWDLQTGKRAWNHAPLGGTHLIAFDDCLVQLTDRIERLDYAGQPQGHAPFPFDEEIDGEVLDVYDQGSMLVVETEDGFTGIDLQGKRLGPVDFEEQPSDPPVTIPGWTLDKETLCLVQDSTGISLAVDGTTQAHGSWWCWTEDGLLFAIRG
ncbi:MAG: hypothetical protein ACPGTU_07375 [Myxococcota bacterium]